MDLSLQLNYYQERITFFFSLVAFEIVDFYVLTNESENELIVNLHILLHFYLMLLHSLLIWHHLSRREEMVSYREHVALLM